ncbi:MAG TPA: hypothetical protein VGL27_03810 [Negativicutes bacterium]|jgi:hypothetical protein
MKIKQFTVSVVVTLALVLVIAMPVWAAMPMTKGNIVNFGDTEIALGATVKNVLVIGGNAIIDGTINDEVVVINGNLTLNSTANVRDHAIVLGGNLVADDGAYIGKGVFRIGGDFAFAGTLVAAGAVIMGLWIINVLLTAVLAIWPGIMAWVWRSGVEDVSAFVSESPVRAVAAGGLGLLALFILTVLLSISMIGIPVAVLVVMVAVGMVAAGMGGVCHALGRQLQLISQQEPGSVFRRTVTGAGISALLFNVPMLGFLALLVIIAAAFGGIVMKIFKKKVA